MSKGNWRGSHALVESLLIIVLLGIVGWVIFSIGEQIGVYTGRDQVNARQHYDSVKENALLSCEKVEFADLAECVTKAIETAHEASNARQDLYAQKDMAGWTFYMAIAAFVTLAVTALGVFYVRSTLVEARETNQYALSAANAAIEANTIMRSEQRPWITLDVTPGCTLWESDDGESCDLTWFYEPVNKGKAPAFDVRVETQMVRLNTKVVGAAAKSVDALIESAKAPVETPSWLPIAFPDRRDGQPIEATTGTLHVGGREEGPFRLFVCVTYALNAPATEWGFEAGVFSFEAVETPTDGMTHRILRNPLNTRIGTWSADHQANS